MKHLNEYKNFGLKFVKSKNDVRKYFGQDLRRQYSDPKLWGILNKLFKKHFKDLPMDFILNYSVNGKEFKKITILKPIIGLTNVKYDYDRHINFRNAHANELDKEQRKMEKIRKIVVAELKDNGYTCQGYASSDYIILDEIRKVVEPGSWAVSFNIHTDWGHDIDFAATEYDIRTPQAFFNDKNFMKKLQSVFNKFAKNGSELKNINLNTVAGMLSFFKMAEKHEYYLTGDFDAMKETTLKRYLRQSESEDDDY